MRICRRSGIGGAQRDRRSRSRRKLPARASAGEHRACSIAESRNQQLAFLAFTSLHARACLFPLLGPNIRQLEISTPPSPRTFSREQEKPQLPRPLRRISPDEIGSSTFTTTKTAKMRATRVLFKHTPLIKFLGRRSVPKRKPFASHAPPVSRETEPLTPSPVQKSTTLPKSTLPRHPNPCPSPSPSTGKRPTSMVR